MNCVFLAPAPSPPPFWQQCTMCTSDSSLKKCTHVQQLLTSSLVMGVNARNFHSTMQPATSTCSWLSPHPGCTEQGRHVARPAKRLQINWRCCVLTFVRHASQRCLVRTSFASSRSATVSTRAHSLLPQTPKDLSQTVQSIMQPVCPQRVCGPCTWHLLTAPLTHGFISVANRFVIPCNPDLG